MHTLTHDEGLIIAREAIELAKGHVTACLHAETRMRARKLLDEAEAAVARGAARPSLAWSCRAVQATNGIRSAAFAEVQAKYDAVYESHLADR